MGFTSSSGQKLRGSNGLGLAMDSSNIADGFWPAEPIGQKSGCRGSLCDDMLDVRDDHYAVLLGKGDVPVFIGESSTNKKCVTSAVPVECPMDAGNVEKRLNGDLYQDSF